MEGHEGGTDWPFISLIIPFYNNQNEVLTFEKKLRDQSYPSDKFELIFIDNGSEIDFNFPASFVSRNILLQENEYKNSPYSARNRGVEHSKGEILVFVDANSLPVERWLERGTLCLLKTGADMAGGQVKFDYQNQVTSGKIVDALTSVQMRKAIEERGVAYTANLFVRKKVFEKAGLFEEGVRSGGDVRWTLEAKRKGFNITFCDGATVYKYARSARQLYRKKIRTGKGYFYTWKNESERNVWFYNLLRSLKPPSFSSIKKLNPERYETRFDRYRIGVWFHKYASGVIEQLAFLKEYLSYTISGKSEK